MPSYRVCLLDVGAVTPEPRHCIALDIRYPKVNAVKGEAERRVHPSTAKHGAVGNPKLRQPASVRDPYIHSIKEDVVRHSFYVESAKVRAIARPRVTLQGLR